MALDGTVISCMAWELNHALAGGKINKIAQPEKDELMLTIKNNRKQYRLLVSASASLPLVYLTDQNKTGPMTAPNFCMLLRLSLIHISEPTRRTPISYAVFCLKKKKKNQYKQSHDK